jgi:hypothetical protein
MRRIALKITTRRDTARCGRGFGAVFRICSGQSLAEPETPDCILDLLRVG